jgi:hypothetical protein
MAESKRVGESIALALLGIVVAPVVLVLGAIGTLLALPTLVRLMPWRQLVARPHRFALAFAILGVKFLSELIATRGYAAVFFGSSISRDTHPRGWRLPWSLRVEHRLLLTLRRYLGMTRFAGAMASWQRRALDWCAANPPTEAQLHLPIPRVQAGSMSPRAFYRRYVFDAHPVILQGLPETAALRDWNPEYFRKYAGDVAPVTETGSEADAVMQSTLGDYLDYVRDNQHLPPERRSAPRYLANFANLCNRHPELRTELDPDRMGAWLDGAGRQVCIGAHLFIGLSGTSTPFHCAVAPNWFFQIQGQKRWTFVHPDHTPMMDPVVCDKAYFSGSLLEYPEPPAETMEIDHPLWKYCPRYEAVLEPGDVLFNPPWYWHRIRNESSPTIGAASRWLILPPARSNQQFDFFLTWHARFFAHAVGLLCRREGEPRLTDETTLTIEQRRHRFELFRALRGRLPSRRAEETLKRAA